MTALRAKARRALSTEEQLAIAWHSASLLLGYPCEDLLTRLEPLHRTSHLLPDEIGGPLRSTVVHLERVPLLELQREYVETFGAARRHDLLTVTAAQSMFEVGAGGPSSQLCGVLEHAATTDPGFGHAVLAGCRDDLERLRLALHEAESGWVGAVQAVTATLPPLTGDV